MNELANIELNIQLVGKVSDGFAAMDAAVNRATEAMKDFGAAARLALKAAHRDEILRKQMRLKLRRKNWRSAK